MTLMLGIVVAVANSQGYDTSVSGSTNAQQDEGEAHIAINPLDSAQMVLGFMEIAPDGLVNFEIYSSSDEGNSWQASSFDPIAFMQNGDLNGYDQIGGGDIVFAYDQSGTLYCSWITLWADLSSTSPFDSCLWKSSWAQSTDNGVTFSTAAGTDKYFAEGLIDVQGAITVLDSADGIADRQWMVVDQTNGPNANKLYVGYINYPYEIANTGLKIKTKLPSETGFSEASVAYLGSGQFTNIQMDSEGVLHYTFVDFDSNHIYHVSSDDGGQTFSDAHLIANGQNVFPENAFKISDRENAAPSLAIDGENDLHLVWADFPFGDPLPATFYSQSTDGGQTWSTPLPLSDIFGHEAFMPVVSAHKNRVSIGAHIFEEDKKTAYYVALSNDYGSSFEDTVRMSSAITDFNTVSPFRFVGDYSSSVRTYCNIYSLWTDCASNGCKQYVAKYDQCAADTVDTLINVGLWELTPVNSEFRFVNLFPNPATDHVQLLLDSDVSGKATLEIMDVSGKTLRQQAEGLQPGENRFDVNTSDLAPGQYFLRFTDPSGTFLTKAFRKV